MPLIPTQEPPYYQITTGPAPAGTLYYTALFDQTATDAPTITELQNTIGDIIWTRSALGTYTGTLNGAFTSNKTLIPGFPNGLFTLPIQGTTANEYSMSLYRENADSITLLTMTTDPLALVEYSSINMGTSFIQIIVYP